MVKMELGQVEKNDIPLLRDMLNRDFAQLLNIHSLYNTYQLNAKFEEYLIKNDCYFFSIKIVQSGDFVKSIIGFGAIYNIDWITRQAQIEILSSDKHGNHLNIENSDDIYHGFQLLLNHCFLELNLNRVWVEVADGLDITEKLETMGFVNEGTRRLSREYKGKKIGTTIFALLNEERRD